MKRSVNCLLQSTVYGCHQNWLRTAPRSLSYYHNYSQLSSHNYNYNPHNDTSNKRFYSQEKQDIYTNNTKGEDKGKAKESEMFEQHKRAKASKVKFYYPNENESNFQLKPGLYGIGQILVPFAVVLGGLGLIVSGVIFNPDDDDDDDDDDKDKEENGAQQAVSVNQDYQVQEQQQKQAQIQRQTS